MGRLCHCDLPEEIMMDILLRLPTESLIRFKCVCKSWCALISDPSFAHKHLHFNNNRVSSSTSVFLSWFRPIGQEPYADDEYERVRSLITISHSDDGEDSNDHIPCVIEDLNLSIIPHEGNDHFTSASHCNGIIWLAPINLYSGETVLYNPAIREFRFLPQTCLGPRVSLSGGFVVVRVQAFGYDSEANDYKFVRILGNFITNECIAEVYTMASDSWREIQIDVNIGNGLCCNNRKGVCCKGVFYWYVSIPNIVLSFDMSSEEFHSIPLPAPHDVILDALPGMLKTLSVWNESVALLITGRVFSSSIEIWVMDNYHSGVKASWTKQLRIGPFASFYTPIMFWKSDELLMRTEDEGIVSYNLGTHKFRRLPIHEVLLETYAGDLFMKSLVSVKREK